MRRKLHWLIVWRLIIAFGLLGTVAVIEQGNSFTTFTPTLLILCLIVGVLAIVYTGVARSRLTVESQIYSQLCIDLMLVTWLVHRTGDIESPFPALYMVIIFAATALLSRRSVFSLAVIGGTLYAVSGALRIFGVIPRAGGLPGPDNQKADSSEFMLALNVIAIFAVTLLASRLAGRLRKSEKELAIATRDLADYRAFNDRIIESMRSGLITTDLRGSVITFNRAAEEITGYKAQDVRGSSVFTIFGDIEKQIEVGLESIRTRSRLPRFDIGCHTADGREIHLGFSVAPLVEEESDSDDDSATPRGYVLTFQDLTEVMELEREVRRQERLAALGKMAAGLAHEI
ncbi:MAG: PAS domain S-box protein, partial [Blastocatellia bacterium]